MKYSKNSIQKIINVFSQNNVKLEFENPVDLYKAINSTISSSVKIHVEEIKKNLCGAEMKEYDVFSKEYLSNIKGYTYAWLSLVGDEKISKQISLIKQAMFYYDGLLDLASPFAICYKQDTNFIEGYYYSFSYKNLIDKDDEFLKLICSGMEFSEKTTDYLVNLRSVNPLMFNIHYLAFDFLSIPRKLGFRTNINSFLKSDILNFYSDYLYFEEVYECVKLCEDYETEVGLQFIPHKDYIAVDINLKVEDVLPATDSMLEYGIISKEEEKYIKTLYYQGMDSGLTNVTLKYKWGNAKKFTIKHYNYFNNENVPSFLTGA
jgi:hypothetical protein